MEQEGGEMIQKIRIENFKSIRALELELGRVNVFIGANGSGKTNILEALAFFAAAACQANPFLEPRMIQSYGVRFAQQEMMCSSFPGVQFVGGSFSSVPARRCMTLRVRDERDEETLSVTPAMEAEGLYTTSPDKHTTRSGMTAALFRLFNPNTPALRGATTQSQHFHPMGIYGEWLCPAVDRLLEARRADVLKRLQALTRVEFIPNGDALCFQVAGNLLSTEQIDEGTLYTLCYLTLAASARGVGPHFFGLDNFGAMLNPKLCQEVLRHLIQLAKEHDKQVLIATNRAEALDGMNLLDEEQRLFVVACDEERGTQVRRVKAPRVVAGREPAPLSEAFVHGYLGGLPNHF